MSQVIAFSDAGRRRRPPARLPLRSALALWIALALGGWAAIGALIASLA